MQTVTREYVRSANKEGTHITLEMLCKHLEDIKPEQEFSIRTLGRALDRWVAIQKENAFKKQVNVRHNTERTSPVLFNLGK